MTRAHVHPWPRAALALLLAAPATARADVAPEACDAAAYERYLGERCLVCEASEYEPDRCRQLLAGTPLRQRCSGTPPGPVTGTSIWGELWCLPRGSTDALPAAPPLLERVSARPGDPVATLPKPPTGFREPPLLAPAADSSSPAADLDPPPDPPPTPRPTTTTPPPVTAPQPATPATAKAPARGCGCRTDDPAWPLLALAPLLLLRRRRRR